MLTSTFLTDYTNSLAKSWRLTPWCTTPRLSARITHKEDRSMKPSLLIAAAVVLNGCGGSLHTPDEQYFLIGSNTKVPYWQEAAAGLRRAAQQLQVKAEMIGPDTYDPKQQQAEFQRVVKLKPSGIMVSPADPKLLQDDIDSAVVSGIPVITMDSDAPASKRLLFIGTNHYQAGHMGGLTAAREMHGKGNVVVF